MRTRALVFIALNVTLLLAAATNARADIVPDQCFSSAEGEACNNALPGNGKGTCRAATCTRALPPPEWCVGMGGKSGAPGGGRSGGGGSGDSAGESGDTGQGGVPLQATSAAAGCGNYGTVSFDCFRCLPASATGGSSAGDGGSTSTGCGCRVGTDDVDTPVAGLMLLVGLSALVWSRRREGTQ